mgnify:CR=1 FL=1
MYYFDYLLFMLPAIILATIASIYTQVTFSKYSRIRSYSGMTGAQAARLLLQSKGVYDVSVEPVHGFLSDHYDPTSKTLRLSDAVYSSPSLSAIGVACHEAGHALQHAANYGWLGLRTALVPAAQIGSYAAYFMIPFGFMFNWLGMIKLGIILFSMAVLFSIITLPVEWNASARAKRMMVNAGIVLPQEASMASAVLNAAFLTYVAGAVTALMTLLYYLLRLGVLGGRRD